MSEEDRVIKLLERLEELRRRGLIDDEYYQEKRNVLLSKYLEVRDETPSVVEERPRPKYGERGNRLTKYLSIMLLVVSVILIFVAVGNIVYPIIKSPTHTTTLVIEKPTTVTKEYEHVVTVTVTATEIVAAPHTFYNQAYIYNHEYIYEGSPNIPYEEVVYSGRLSIEKGCQVRGFPIDVEKGDVIEVYWEADDDDAYFAIGTPAHYTENIKNVYCEVLILFWKSSWPEAGHGYSGSLRFTVPSSGTWYVVVANGNYYCLFRDCPITITRLEIKHLKG